MTEKPRIPPYPKHLTADERLGVLNLATDRHAGWMLDDANKAVGSEGRNLPAPMDLVIGLHAREVILGQWRDERLAGLEKKIAELEAKLAAAKPKAARP